MKSRRGCISRLGLLIVVAACGAGPVASIPEPPHQRDPWTPPATKLSPVLVASATKLFDLGMADPRGGEYRAFEVAEGMPEGGWVLPGRRPGWIFPPRVDGASRFAVGWDGLLVPVAQVGEPADPTAGPPRDRYRPDAIQVCLLLRLGRVAEAERAWAELVGPAEPPGVDLAMSLYSLDELVRDLSWSLYVRAAGAFERGDDGLALHDVRLLTHLAREYDRDATARRVPHPRMAGGDRPLPYLEYLDQLPRLLADLERRAGEPARPAVPPPGRGDRGARVAALIRDLDRIGPEPSDRDAHFNYFQSRAFRALTAEGDAAVGPLLEAFRHDERLTRIVREGQHRLDPISVAEIAFDALRTILKFGDLGGEPVFAALALRRPADRLAVAERIRDYWDQRKNRAVAERWYLSLADDAGGEREWIEAARQIVAPEPGRPWIGDLPPAGRPAPAARMQGEALRSGHTPTVADLLNRRAAGLTAAVSANPRAANSTSVAWMADCALAWDPVAALPALQAASRLLRAESETAGSSPTSRRSLLLVQLSRYVVPRVGAGDHAAAAEYAALLRRSNPREVETNLAEILTPLHRLPDEPALVEVADWMFNNVQSPWQPFAAASGPTAARANRAWDDLVSSSLLVVPSWRAAMLARLNERTNYGTARPSGTQQWRVETQAGSQSFERRREGDAREPAQPKPVAFRLGDFVAWRLSTVAGCPPFALWWSEADRDAAIPKIRSFFERFGARLVADDPVRIPGRWISTEPHPPYVDFPALDHPASVVDVAAGRALFTLERPDDPPADRRLVPMPARPLLARWEPPRPIPKRGEPPPPVIVITERMGRVWQVEEVREGDQWRRYFGVALPHEFARIPADEVNLWNAFNFADGHGPGGFDGQNPAQLNPPDATPQPLERSIEVIPFALGTPVVVPIRLRNPSGLDLAVPAETFRREGGHVKAVHRRLLLNLRWEPLPTIDGSGRPQFDSRAGRSVELRADLARFNSTEETVTLGPAGSLESIKVDLRDLFPIDRPGRYSLRVNLTGPPTRPLTGVISQRPGIDSQPIAFEVAEPPPGAP